MGSLRHAGVLLVFSLALVLPALATDYYVSPAGSDAGGDGSQARPWRTIQRAADMMVAGDTCHVANGEYPEMVRPSRDGAPGQFISFVADGASARVTGARQITGWTVHSGNIWRANVSWTFDELFADGQRMVLARWPNLTSGDIYRPDFYQATANGGKTSIIDASHLTQPAGYWSGAKIFMVPGLGWTADRRDVSGYDPATHQILFSPAITFSSYYDADQYSLYFLYDKLPLLDAPSEWYLDGTAGIVYTWMPDGSNPNGHLVESSGGNGGFDLNDRSHIRISGFKFMSGDIRLKNATGCRVEDIRHLYPAAMLYVSGSDNTITRSEIGFAGFTGVRLDGTQNTLSKCHVHHCAYAANESGAFSSIVELGGYRTYYAGAWQNSVTDCSLHDTGRDGILISGGPGLSGCIIEHNEIYNTGLIAKDLGGFYSSHVDGGGTQIRYNIVHDVWPRESPQYGGLRMGTGIYLDENSRDFSVHHNLVYRIAGYAIMLHHASLYDLVYNNTAVSSGGGWGDAIDSSPGGNVSGILGIEGSVIANNLAVSFDGRKGFDGQLGWCIRLVSPLPVFHHNGYHNPLTTSRFNSQGVEGTGVVGDPLFACSDGNDFTLLAGSPMIDKGAVIPGITDGYTGTAPDIGAYERGGTERPGPRDEWWLASQSLTVHTGAGGTTSPGPGIYSLKQGRSVCLTAVPDYRYKFANWTGDASGTTASLLITLDGDKTVKANFQRIIYAAANAAGQRILNRSLGQAEYIDVLSWEANSNNADLNILEYRIYLIEGTSRTLLGTVASGAELKFARRGSKKGVQAAYEIAAVVSDGREGDPASVTVR